VRVVVARTTVVVERVIAGVTSPAATSHPRAARDRDVSTPRTRGRAAPAAAFICTRSRGLGPLGAAPWGQYVGAVRPSIRSVVCERQTAQTPCRALLREGAGGALVLTASLSRAMLARAGRAPRSYPNILRSARSRARPPCSARCSRPSAGSGSPFARKALSRAARRPRGRGPERLVKLVSTESLDGLRRRPARSWARSLSSTRCSTLPREGRRRTRRAYLASPDEVRGGASGGAAGDRPTPEEMTPYASARDRSRCWKSWTSPG